MQQIRTSPLYAACEKGHEGIVQALLNNNAKVNFCTENGKSPLHIASQNGHNETVELLLKNNAEVNVYTTKKGTSPLYIACE